MYMLRVLAVACLCATQLSCFAQNPLNRPINDGQATENRLFSIPEDELNHRLRADLPGNSFLLIELTRLSAWPDDHNLQGIFDLAKRASMQFRDSFQSASSSKTIELSIPSDGYPEVVRLRESGQENRLLVLDKTNTAPFKITMDTIRILKTHGEKKGEPQQVQYLFILKNLEDADGLAANAGLVNELDTVFNNIVAQRRRRHRNQDRWTLHVGAHYDATNPDVKGRLKESRSLAVFEMLDVDCSAGVSLFRNQLAPYVEVGYSLKTKVEPKTYSFVKASGSTQSFFHQVSRELVDMRANAFVNLEGGLFFIDNASKLPLYHLSLGFGYNIGSREPYGNEVHGRLYRMFFNYSVSKSVTLMTDFYLTPKAGQQPQHVFTGLTLKVHLLNGILSSVLQE